jgi:hypothetical protein
MSDPIAEASAFMFPAGTTIPLWLSSRLLKNDFWDTFLGKNPNDFAGRF